MKKSVLSSSSRAAFAATRYRRSLESSPSWLLISNTDGDFRISHLLLHGWRWLKCDCNSYLFGLSYETSSVSEVTHTLTSSFTWSWIFISPATTTVYGVTSLELRSTTFYSRTPNPAVMGKLVCVGSWDEALSMSNLLKISGWLWTFIIFTVTSSLSICSLLKRSSISFAVYRALAAAFSPFFCSFYAPSITTVMSRFILNKIR